MKFAHFITILLIFLTMTNYCNADRFKRIEHYSVELKDGSRLVCEEVIVAGNVFKLKLTNEEWRVYELKDVALITDKFARIFWPESNSEKPDLATSSLLLASEDLHRFTRLSYLSIGLQTTGAIAYLAGLDSDSKTLKTVGSVCVAGSYVIAFTIPLQIGKAGDHLETYARSVK